MLYPKSNRMTFYYEKIPSNHYSRNSRNKGDEVNNTPISTIDDYQSSMSAFSTRNESKTINNNDNKDNKNVNKEKKKVKFNPLIVVVNIESFKKENFEGNFTIEESCHNENFEEKKEKKCFLCSIF